MCIMFVLIGVGALVSSVYRGTFSFPFDSWWNLIWIFFVVFWIFPWFFGWGWWGWGGYRYRRWYRYNDDAYEILKQRYAKGEITKEQFDQMIRDLEQHSQ